MHANILLLHLLCLLRIHHLLLLAIIIGRFIALAILLRKLKRCVAAEVEQLLVLLDSTAPTRHLNAQRYVTIAIFARNWSIFGAEYIVMRTLRLIDRADSFVATAPQGIFLLSTAH